MGSENDSNKQAKWEEQLWRSCVVFQKALKMNFMFDSVLMPLGTLWSPSHLAFNRLGRPLAAFPRP